MGIGCVLFLWVLVGAVFAAIGGAFCFWVAVLLRRDAPRSPKRWLFIAPLLPFGLLLYGVIAFCAYAVWCENTRGVDAGIGDTWRVPVTNGWMLVMIDETKDGTLRSPDGRAISHEVTRLGSSDRWIFGEERSSYFLIDSDTASVVHTKTEEELMNQLMLRGVVGRQLESPGAFYDARRWQKSDLYAAIVLAIPPILGMLLLVRHVFRSLDGPV